MTNSMEDDEADRGQVRAAPASFCDEWRARLSGYNLVGESKQTQQASGWRRTTIALIITGVVLLAFAALFLVSLILKPSNVIDPHMRLQGFEPGPYVQYRLGPRWHNWGSIKHMVIFGDSWSSTGSRPTTTPPTTGDVIGKKPAFPGDTNTNGPSWPTYLGTTFNRSEMSIANFAIGGATMYNADQVDDYRTLKKQVTEYYPQARAKTEGDKVIYDWNTDETLAVFWSGVNDVHDWALDKNRTKPWYFERDFKLMVELLDQIYQSGARNFLIMDAPPMDKSPMATIGQDVEDWADAVRLFNEQLYPVVQNFTETYEDITMFFFGVHELLNAVMKKPCDVDGWCGMLVTDRMCWGYIMDLTHAGWNRFDPNCIYGEDKYLWLNKMHLTTVTHNNMAHAFFRALMYPEEKAKKEKGV